ERSRADLLLELAGDELILGWRNSEWTGIAAFLEEDVAFSSIAQNEIGHAQALDELAAADLGTTADELAFDRGPDGYRCARLARRVEEKLRWTNHDVEPIERGEHLPELTALWEEMTVVRRSAPAGTQW